MLLGGPSVTTPAEPGGTEKGSIAYTSPARSLCPRTPETFGMDWPAWTTNRAILWPVRFLIGSNPLDLIALSIAAPMSEDWTPALTIFRAASRPASAASTIASWRGSRLTVTAVSAMYPSTWTPMSTLTRAPSWTTDPSPRGDV